MDIECFYERPSVGLFIQCAELVLLIAKRFVERLSVGFV